MLKKLWALALRYRAVLLYLIFGGLTTLINIAVYYVAAHPLGLSTAGSTVVAWLLAVAFAYLTNRRWVFDSKAKGGRAVAKEAAAFYGARLLTGLLDLLIMYVCVDLLHWNDLVIKIASNILVIVLNYVFSKFLIFRR